MPHSPPRPLRFAACYPPRIKSALDAWFAQVSAPLSSPYLIAPHIDLHRGGPTYARAYACLDPTRATYLILGTSHRLLQAPFVATTSDYQTPFGTLPVNSSALAQLTQHLGPELLHEQDAHHHEHSIEFQATLLAYCAHRAGLQPPSIVPILCGQLGDQYVSPQQNPAARQGLHALHMLCQRLGDRLGLIAGVDLAHQGPAFGDPDGLCPQAQNALQIKDLRTIRHMQNLDERAFWRDVTAQSNPRRICGLSPIYTLLWLLRGQDLQGHLLDYQQALSPRQDVVSHAAMVFAATA